MTDGCFEWLTRLLLVEFRVTGVYGGSGVYITSIVAAFVDVDIKLNLPTEGLRECGCGRISKA